MPFILALSPMLCSVLLGREGPHPLLYFRPFSNYTLTLVIYIMSLIAKCRYWRCWEALGPVPARPRLGRWHPPVALVRSCWSSPAASQHLASAPPETALESRTQVSRRGTESRTACQQAIGDGLSGLRLLDVLHGRHRAPSAARVARGSVPCP